MARQSHDIPRRAGGTLNAVLFHAGSASGKMPSNLVILCHGFSGDKYEWDRFPMTASSLNAEGYDALIFDFSGSGENPREPVTLTQQVRDLEDVHEWAVEQGYKHTATIGLSFGGITSLLAEMPTRVAAVFWAPGFFMKRVIGRKIHLARFIMALTRKPIYRKSSGEHAPVIMGKSFFDDVLRIDPCPALASFTTPSLVIQGLADTDVRPALTREAVSHMPRDEHHELVEIDGATHNFAGEHLKAFISHTVGWLNKYMK